MRTVGLSPTDFGYFSIERKKRRIERRWFRTRGNSIERVNNFAHA